MQEAKLRQVTVEENRTIDNRAAAVVGNHKESRVRRKSVDDLAGRGIEAFIDLANGVAKLRCSLWIVEKVLLIHVLPEVMLNCVDRHEDKHHYVLRMILQQVERGFRPLVVHLLHLGEHLVAPLIGRHRAEEPEIELDSDERRNQVLRSEEHTSELQSRFDLVCRLLLEKKKTAKM